MRLFEEATYIDNKIALLERFIGTDEYNALSFKARMYLHIQLFFMRQYYCCLSQRMTMHCTVEDVENYATTLNPNVETTPLEKPKAKRRNRKKKSNE